ncbi:hypothetical protein RF55_25184, partial [Lasius niger]
MIQRVHVRHQAVEQVGLAETGDAARRQRQDLAEGEHPQVRQHAEGGVVADHALGVAPGGAEDRRAAYAGGGQHVVEVFGIFQLMRHQQGGLLMRSGIQRLHHPLFAMGIEAGGRFIEQQQAALQEIRQEID